MSLLYKLTIILALILNYQSIQCCPFASYKRGRFLKKECPSIVIKSNSSEVLNHMQRRYDLALSELQFQCPYDLFSFHQKELFLEQALKKADSYSERRAIRETSFLLQLLYKKGFRIHLSGRDRYKEFIRAMRLASENNQNANWRDSETHELINEILQTLSLSHFTVNLNDSSIGYRYFWEIVPKQIANFDPANINVQLVNKIICKILPVKSMQVLLSRIRRKWHSFIFASWDGAIATTRSKMVSYQRQGKKVDILRMSCPVYGKNYRFSLDPIFLEYLRCLKAKNKKHLYISDLNVKTNGFSKEYKMSKLLQALSKDPDFKDVFNFVILPVDSPFYKQGNLGLLRASYFKESFINSMLLKQDGFFFPSTILTNRDFIAALGKILEEVHSHYFDGNQFLERIERCQFIDIAYAKIAEYLMDFFEVDYANWSGINGVDDSMKSTSIFDMLQQTKTQETLDLNTTIYLCTWPAITHFHRHPHTNSSIRNFSAVQKLIEVFENKDSSSNSSEFADDLKVG